MIRVALVVGRLNVGGAEAELVRLANGLDRARFLPRVVTLQDRGPLASRLAPDVELVELGRPRKWSWGTYRALGEALREGKPDIVQSFLFTENAFCRRIGAGIVVSGIQGSISDARETGPSLKLSVERWTWGGARAVVSNSRFYRELYGALGLDASKIEVIPSGVEVREADGGGVRERFGVRPEEVLVTCVARLVERKGHEDLIRAGAGLRLLFVGDGPFRRRLEGRGAILAGWRPDVPQILAASDIVVLASRFGEGCPNAVLEAMAQARPVVAARSGGTPEVVVDGETGILVAPQDVAALREALHRLAADPALRRRMGEAGRARARERFGIGRMVKSYADLFFKLTEGGPSV
jgi:glycosyltransferase involved in cell wall biosynthesis